MKKRTIMASFLAVALALLASPIGSLDYMPWVSAEEDSKVVDPMDKEQLDAPVNLRWLGESASLIEPNDKYTMCWEGVIKSVNEDGQGLWRVDVYKDEQQLYFDQVEDYCQLLFGEYDGHIQHRTPLLTDMITESGSYKFRIGTSAWPGDMTYRSSEWSEWSESIAYIRPERELGIANICWDQKENGICHFTPLNSPEELMAYVVTLYRHGEDGTWDVMSWFVFYSSEYVDVFRKKYGIWQEGYDFGNMAVVDVDFSDAISRSGEGKYCVTVQAFSSNIDVVANGMESPKSDILDTTVNVEKLSGILNSATDKSATETVELLKGSAELSIIQQAMQTSDIFREQIKNTEERYAAEQNVIVGPPAVSDRAREYVDSSKVSVVGAAFNITKGKGVSLQIDVTPEEKRVSIFPRYQKEVQLDIRLVSDNKEIHDLAMPVSVTMPVPQGINASRLLILHYHADGTMEQTAFHVNSDGTITFTVSNFSPFVFVEKSSTDIPTDKPDSTPDHSTSGNSDNSGWFDVQADLESQIASAAPGAIIKVTKEQNINTLPNSTMQMLVKRGDVALEMEYTYEGVDYHIVIPAGGAVDNDIDWYGPLYLSAYFNVANVAFESDFSDSVEEVNLIYVVKKGDMLEKIARSYNTTVARLMAANPQIKNANRITPGQIINIR